MLLTKLSAIEKQSAADGMMACKSPGWAEIDGERDANVGIWSAKTSRLQNTPSEAVAIAGFMSNSSHS
jgi:hypothetical protein